MRKPSPEQLRHVSLLGKPAVLSAVFLAKRCLLLIFGLALCLPVYAVDLNHGNETYYHTSWTLKDGVPGEIHALAQTTDGFLWLGTASGLFRFDGVQFQPYKPASGQPFRQRNIYSLFATEDGGLWVGYWYGGVSFIRGGQVTDYGTESGLPSSAVLAFAQDHTGAIWAAAGRGGLARLTGAHWEKIGAEWGFSDVAQTVFVDRDGALWVGTSTRIEYLPVGGKRFQIAADGLQIVMRFAEAPDGVLWMAETHFAVRRVPLSRKLRSQQGPEFIVGSQSIAFDHQGNLWIASLGDGVRRVPSPSEMPPGQVAVTDARLDSFTEKDGLTGDLVYCVLVDREGNIWVGTSGGLDQFRRSSFGFLSTPKNSSITALAAGNQGSLWVASVGPNYLTRFDHDSTDFQLQGPYIDTAYRDRKGFIWLGIPDYIARLEEGGASSIRVDHESDALKWIPGLPAADVQVTGHSFRDVNFGRLNPPVLPGMTRRWQLRPRRITEDRLGRLWISMDSGTFRLDGSGWKSLTSLGGPSGSVNTEFTDSKGLVWFGMNNTVMALDEETVRTFSAGDGVDIGTITSIQERDSKIWIGGEFGLEYFDGHRFQIVQPDDGTSFAGVFGIVASHGDGLWFSDNRGIVHIPEAQLAQLSRTNTKVAFRAYGTLDGFNAEVRGSLASPAAVQTTDGRIWLATTKGLYWIDPDHEPQNTLAPPVFIESLFANGRRYDGAGITTLPAGTKDLQITYTATSLTIPQRVLFQYRLDGQDKAWVQPGTRREAFYTNLAPGKYAFHVIACNNDGVWNVAGATLSIVIEPAWFQTVWFQLWCLAGVLLIIWCLYRLRVRQIAKSVSARFDERLAERTQIALELHDTLVQTIQGSKMVADDALEGCSEPRTRRALEKLSVWLAQATDESRAALNSLRLSTVVRNDLAEALQRACENKGISESMSLTFSVVGDAREMHPIVRDEVYRIAYEAIRNAQAHSHATSLVVELRYGQDLTVQVQDNGVGIDPGVADHGKEGHFGLQGMRERAARIRGKLTIMSSVATGTKVLLGVPAVIAFSNEKLSLLSRVRLLFMQLTGRLR
jgi:signal transduction histidine kinase/ligand-binding sensor domain-containing protein